MTLRSRPVVIALLAVVVLALGIGGAVVLRANTTSTTDAPSDPFVILVMGDSYSSGNGAADASGEQRLYGPAACRRSKVTWAELYAARLREQGRTVQVRNVACSGAASTHFTSPRPLGSRSRSIPTPTGATTADQALDIITKQDVCRNDSAGRDEQWTYAVTAFTTTTTTVRCDHALRPQVDSVTADVDLVVFTMGGNDIGFGRLVTSCFAGTNATQCAAAVQAARAATPAVADRLVAGIEAMSARGLRRDARVVQLGYPYLQLDNNYTLGTYAAGDQVRALSDLGNDLMTEVARRANSGGSAKVSAITTVTERFAGHEPDARGDNPQRWVNELFEGGGPADFYHLNRRGHEAYAALLAERTDLLP